MSAHAPHISEDVLRRLPSQVSQVAQKLLLMVGIVTTVLTIAGEWAHGGHVLNHWLVDNVSVLGALLNILLVALVLFPGRIHPLNGDVHDPIVRSAAKCINAFCLPALTWFWRCLGLLYVVQLFRTLAEAHRHDVLGLGDAPRLIIPLSATCIEFFSVGSTFFILLGYGFLTPGFLREHIPLAATLRSPGALRDLARWRSSRLFWKYLAIAVPLAFGMVLTRVFLLLVPDPMLTGNLATVVNGVASAIAFGFFIGRMDSKFVLNWQWAIPILYSYAGIQVYSTVLYAPAPFDVAVFSYAAFTMKCILFIFLSNFFETRRVLYYAVELVESESKDV